MSIRAFTADYDAVRSPTTSGCHLDSRRGQGTCMMMRVSTPWSVLRTMGGACRHIDLRPFTIRAPFPAAMSSSFSKDLPAYLPHVEKAPSDRPQERMLRCWIEVSSIKRWIISDLFPSGLHAITELSCRRAFTCLW